MFTWPAPRSHWANAADCREGHVEMAHWRAGRVHRKSKATPLGALAAVPETIGIGIFVAGVLTAL
jgi:hypothetical protein